jgi:hypothetical protein
MVECGISVTGHEWNQTFNPGLYLLFVFNPYPYPFPISVSFLVVVFLEVWSNKDPLPIRTITHRPFRPSTYRDRMIVPSSYSRVLVFLSVYWAVIVWSTTTVAAQHDDTSMTIPLLQDHADVLTLHDESFRQAIGLSPAGNTKRGTKKQTNWLLWFHTTGDTTQIAGDVPTLPDIALASINVKDGSETMKRLGVRHIPSFVCLRGDKFYRYDNWRPVNGYSWEELVEFCRHPPAKQAHTLPPPVSAWKHFRMKVLRSPALQMGALVLVAVLGLLAAAVAGHFLEPRKNPATKVQ